MEKIKEQRTYRWYKDISTLLPMSCFPIAFCIAIFGIKSSIDKQNEFELFDKYKTKQNAFDFTMLQGLRAQKQHMKNDISFQNALQQYEEKYARAVDSIKYVHKKDLSK